ncbi:(2Fe-2S)-binding protein [Actinocatenispora thailandica]|uniref:(2Fe-2S)-binding protein n=1 Tax=Actinocatenispora thailandica TaxID=227318 RepID=UPI0031DD805A
MSDVTRSAARPDVTRSDVSRSDVSRSDASLSDVTRSAAPADAVQPAVSRPGVSRPDAVRPDAPPPRPGASRYRAGVELPEPVSIVVDGRPVPAHPGESLAAALFAAGARATRRTASGALRGPYCNMGVCFECLVTVDGVPAIRSCTLPVRAGIRVETNR